MEIQKTLKALKKNLEKLIGMKTLPFLFWFFPLKRACCSKERD